MENVTIELTNGTFEGNVHIKSTSNFSAWRVPRSSFADHKELIEKNGVYIFLMDQNKIYIGESGDIFERNQGNSGHRDDLDTRWHTLIAFPCSDNVQDNQLRFIENALCEHFYAFSCNGERCLTNKSPAQSSCNDNHRRKNYRLSPVQINNCYQYVKDILDYISLLRDPHFTACTSLPRPCVPSVEASQPALQNVQTEEGEWHEFYYPAKGSRSRIHGNVLIQFINEKHGKAILKKDSIISDHEAKDCGDKAIRKRKEAQRDGKILNWILQEDIEFDNANVAIRFLTGNSASAPSCWISKETNKKLKDY